FFLPSFARRPALHSFPTRRSSDLDLFEADIGEATVVTLFLFETLNRRLLPKLLRELEPGTRIVAHRYGFGGDWLPDKTVQAGARDRKSTRLNSSHLGISYAVFCLK